MLCRSLHCTDLKKILELDPSNDQARKGIRRLEPLAAEKREKMKEEAIGKKRPCLCFRLGVLHSLLSLDTSLDNVIYVLGFKQQS